MNSMIQQNIESVIWLFLATYGKCKRRKMSKEQSIKYKGARACWAPKQKPFSFPASPEGKKKKKTPTEKRPQAFIT